MGKTFSSKHKASQVVAKKLLEEILPRYGVPEVIGLDSGPAFISKVLHELTQAVGTNFIVNITHRALGR